MKTPPSNEATQNWKNLIKYYYEILKYSRRGQKIFINLKESAKNYLDLSEVFEEETLLYGDIEEIAIRRPKTAAKENYQEEVYEIEKQSTPFDKLRRIYDHVTNNPHELEVLYCYLFICGRKDTPAKEEVFAPLVAVPAQVDYTEGAFKVKLASDECRINTFALAELYPEKESALLAPDFLESPFLPLNLDGVSKLLRTIGDLHPSIRCQEFDKKYNQIDKPKLVPGQYIIQNTAICALTKKDNVYLINNLKNLLDEDFGSVSKSVLGRFLQKDIGSTGSDPQPEPTTRAPLLFPFKNNPSQRNVAEQLMTSQLVHVKGPPGTGKSQTIANLVCHLVASGRTVLVTSQKNKALEVVGEMLDRLSLKYLYMMLLRDDKESKKKLKDLVEELIAEVSSYNEESLSRELQRWERKLKDCNSDISKLHQEFRDAQNFERKEKDGHSTGEIYAHYEKIKNWDYFDKKEIVSKENASALKLALGSYISLLSTVGKNYERLTQLIEDESIPKTPEAINTFLDGLVKLYKLLDEELSLSPPAQTEDLQGKCPSLRQPNVETLKQLEKLKEEVQQFIVVCRDISCVQELSEIQKELSETEVDLRGLVKKDVPGLEEVKRDIERFFEITTPFGTSSFFLREVESALKDYQVYKKKWFKFKSLNPSSRTVLETVTGKQWKKLTEKEMEGIQRAIDKRSLLEFINQRLEHQFAYLKIPPLDALSANRINTLGQIDKRVKLLYFLQRREELDFGLKNHLGDFININDCNPDNEEEIISGLDQVLAITKVLIIRQEALELLRKLELAITEFKIKITCLNDLCGKLFSVSFKLSHLTWDSWKVKCPLCSKSFSFAFQDKKFEIWGLTKYHISYAYEAKDRQKLASMLETIQRLLPSIPRVLQLQEMGEGEPLKRYPRTASKFRDLYLQDPDQFKILNDNLDTILDAVYLRTLIKEVESQKVRSTEEIASDIRHYEEEKLKIITKYIGTAIKLNITIALAKSGIHNDLSHFITTLQRSKKRFTSFERLKKEMDFGALLSVLPCWIVSIEDVARIFPLEEGLFDVVIVDESSQCGIPSAIPILYRGKKAVIVGDDKQLHNIEYQFIKEDFNESLLRECTLEKLPRSQAFNAKENSLFDLCSSFKDYPIFLNEHFRCYPEIIRFCNEKFYNNRLLLTRICLENKLGPILNLHVVEGAYDDESMKVNKREAEALVAKLKELLADTKYCEMSFGIMSIFREQVEFLKDLVFNEILPSTRKEFRIIVETADGFQGDERDVILYSFRYAPNSSPNIFALLRKEEDYKRLNVALSRARNQIFCFVSVPPCDFPNVLHLKDYLMYVQDPKSLDFDYKPWDSAFEEEVHEQLKQKGLKVYPQFKTCGFRIDLVVTDSRGKVLAIECDGWKHHYDEYGELFPEDVERQKILERAGWKVKRITSRDFYRDREKALKPFWEYFEL